MADWLLHYATGRAAVMPARSAVLRECLLLGVVVPDLPAKALILSLHFLDRRWGVDTDVEWTKIASHVPLLWAGMAYLLAHLFREPLRPAAFAGLLLGGWLHIALDCAKDTMGAGVSPLAFPFSLTWHDFGWYYHEDTLKFTPWALGAILAIEGAAGWRSKRFRAAARPPEAAPP